MLFHSLDFAIFLPIVFTLYWFVLGNHLRAQNLLIVVASYVFYGWWDWRFLSLIFFSSLVDYVIGRGLLSEQNERKRKFLLYASIAINLGMLGTFKYYNFFVENFVAAFSLFGFHLQPNMLNLILPVGISFYTFQTLSYSIDVYRRKLTPTKDFISFLAFVSFFPQLVAGPIERATNLLPQFYKKRTFDYGQTVDGLRQILFGLFKKIVIADNCAIYSDIIFNDPWSQTGSTLILGLIFFNFQIYGDFSGYSDIAIGTSRLFGFNLMQNFAFPYFSRDMAEFWRRWHISLSTWFRDYLYIPLGGSKLGKWGNVRNTFIIFLISGFWHGASWTFIIWAAINAIYFLPLLLWSRNRKYMEIVAYDRKWPSLKEVSQMLLTFLLTGISRIFFRANDMEHALNYLQALRAYSFWSEPKPFPLSVYVLMAVFVVIEWLGRRDKYALQTLGFSWGRPARWAMYYAMAFLVFYYAGKDQPFIYFQF